MPFLLFALIGFAYSIFPPTSYSAVTIKNLPVPLDADTAKILRKTLNDAEPGVPARVRRPSHSTTTAGASETKDQPWTFYGLDGESAYLVELPLRERRLTIVKQVPKPPEEQLVVDFRDVGAFHDTIARKQRTSSSASLPRRGRPAKPTRPAPPQRAASGTPRIPPITAGATGTAGSKIPKKPTVAAFSDIISPDEIIITFPAFMEVPNEVFSHVEQFLLARSTGRVAEVSQALRKHRMNHRAKRLAELKKPDKDPEQLYQILQTGETPPSKWERIERDRIEEVARYYLDRQSPEKAFHILTKNGVSLEDLSRLHQLPELKDVSAHVLLMEAALEMGHFEKVVDASLSLMYRAFYDRTKKQMVRVHFDSESGRYVVRSGNRRGKYFEHGTRIHLLHARALMAMGDSRKARTYAAIAGSKGNSSATHQSKALLAEQPLWLDDVTTFLSWGDTLIDSPHLSTFQKHQVALRLGTTRFGQGRHDEATQYFKKVIAEADPSDPHYIDALNKLFDVNAVTKHDLDFLKTFYEALYKGQIPYSHHKQLMARIQSKYGGISLQERFLKKRSRTSRILSQHLDLEKARIAIVEGQPKEASSIVERLLDPAKTPLIPEKVEQAARRYRETIKLQRAQELAQLDDIDEARAILKEVVESDAASLPEEIPILKAQHLAQRSITHTQLGDYTAAMDDLWEIMQTHRKLNGAYRTHWNNEPLEEVFQQGYQKLMDVLRRETPLTTIQQKHQLQLLQSSLAVLSDQWDFASDHIDALGKALAAGSYNAQQQTVGHLIQARLIREVGRYDEAITAYQKALEQKNLLSLRDRFSAYLGLGKSYIFAGKNDQAIYAFNVALQQSGLSQDNLMVVRSRLAHAYIQSGNPEYLSDAISLLAQALRDHERYHKEVMPHLKSSFFEMNLLLARTLSDYAKLKKSGFYGKRALHYYEKAEALAPTPEDTLEILKEKTDQQFQAYLEKRWKIEGEETVRTEAHLTPLYERLAQESKDLVVKAQAFMNLGYLAHSEHSYMTALRHYAKAEELKKYLSPPEQALLRLRANYAAFESALTSRYTYSRIKDDLLPAMEEALQAGLESGVLKGKDLLKAHEYLGRAHTKFGKHRDAYRAYTAALDMTEGVEASDKVQTYQYRAALAIAQKDFDAALADYDTLFKIDHVASRRIGEEAYAKIYLERSRILQRFGQNERVFDDIHQHLLTARRSHEETLQAGRLFQSLLFDQFLRGNPAGARRLITDYRAQYTEVFALSEEMLQLLDAAIALEQNPSSKNLNALNLLITTGTVETTLNAQIMPHQQKPFWRRIQTTLIKGQLRNKQYNAAEASLYPILEASHNPKELSPLMVLLAQSYYGQKRYTEAYTALTDTLDPAQLDPLFQKRRLGTLGNLAMQRKDYEDAVRQYRAAEAISDTEAASLSYSQSLKWAQLRNQAQRFSLFPASTKKP